MGLFYTQVYLLPVRAATMSRTVMLSDLIASLAKHCPGELFLAIVEEFYEELYEHFAEIFEADRLEAMAPDRYEDDA